MRLPDSSGAERGLELDRKLGSAAKIAFHRGGRTPPDDAFVRRLRTLLMDQEGVISVTSWAAGPDALVLRVDIDPRISLATPVRANPS